MNHGSIPPNFLRFTQIWEVRFLTGWEEKHFWILVAKYMQENWLSFSFEIDKHYHIHLQTHVHLTGPRSLVQLHSYAAICAALCFFFFFFLPLPYTHTSTNPISHTMHPYRHPKNSKDTNYRENDQSVNKMKVEVKSVWQSCISTTWLQEVLVTGVLPP